MGPWYFVYWQIFKGWTAFNKNRSTYTDEVLYIGRMDTPTSFILIITFFDGASEYGGGSKLWDYVGTSAELLGA
jgi:hypothetical protein